MQKDPRHTGPRLWFLWPLATASLALGLLWVRLPARTVHLDAPPGREDGGQLESLADSLLTDSILSIIQSYYVDSSRVRNRTLLETAFETLSASPRIDAQVERRVAWIEIDGERRTYPLDDRPSYHDVLEIFNDVARRLDGKGIEVPMGEGEDRDPTGAVLLLNALLSSLDAHSALLSREAYRELRQGTEGAFGGLGVLVGIRNDVLTVIKPLPRSPASRAGIRKHDRILGIDGISTYGQTLDALVEYMRGDPGTTVNLSLLRDGAESPTSLAMQREVIQVDSVTSRKVERGGAKALHLTIENFANRTSKEVLSAIKTARVENGGVLHGLILDLRGNPGGLLDQAVQVADLFLQSGVIVTTKGRRQEVETAGNGFDEIDFPVVVLIDGESASASEIVAGALQDHGRAVVIGQPSFGKGSVQTIFELPGERALKLTIARYYTPHGRSIQNVGIIPDVWLQPVYKSDRNVNLFGYYRYKNERFLKNHLTDLDGKGPRKASLRVPAQKGFYLTDGNEDQRPDLELDLAVDIIKKLRDTYGDRLPRGAGRASHWLGLAGPEVRARLERLDGDVTTWLKREHRLDWTTSGLKSFTRDVTIEARLPQGDTVRPGEKVRIDWRIVNKEKEPVDRVSIFVRSESSGLETHEVLIGRLPAGKARSGSLEIDMPPWLAPGLLNLRVGVAASAWPLPEATAPLPVTIVDRPVAEIVASVDLVEERGGKVAGHLEQREKAKVRILLKNLGQAPARNLAVGLDNLSGTQVKVESDLVTVHEIGPGESRVIDLAIEGGKLLYTPEIGLGLHVTSNDMKWPLRERVALKAIAGGKTVSNLLGH